MNDPNEQRGVGQLLSDLSQGVTTLFRKEAELVRAELREKITQVEVGAGSIAAGAIWFLATRYAWPAELAAEEPEP